MAICVQAGGGNLETQAGCWILEQAATSIGCKVGDEPPPGGRHYVRAQPKREDDEEGIALMAVTAVMVIDDGNN